MNLDEYKQGGTKGNKRKNNKERVNDNIDQLSGRYGSRSTPKETHLFHFKVGFFNNGNYFGISRRMRWWFNAFLMLIKYSTSKLTQRDSYFIKSGNISPC